MKRLLSAILVMAMTIALVPAVFAAEGDTAAEPIVIEFSSGTFKFYNANGTEFTETNTSYASYTYDNEMFEIVDDGTFDNVTFRPWNKDTAVSGKTLLWINTYGYVTGKDKGLFTIKTNKLEKGTYDITVKVLMSNTNASVTDGQAYDVLVDEVNIGSFDTYSETSKKFSSSSEIVDKEVGQAIVTPDDDGYTKIQFKSKCEEASACYLGVYQIICTPVAGEEGEEPETPAEDEALTAAFEMDDIKTVENYSTSVSALTYIDGEEKSNSVITASATKSGAKYKMTTSSTDESYTFLYWVKGLDGGAKKIISREQSFTYSASGTGANYLIAVYEKDGATEGKAEFYNANGQLIDKAEAVTTVTLPEIPGIAGFTAATQWGCTDGKIYNPGDEVTISGTMQFMPIYGSETRASVSGGQLSTATEAVEGATWKSSQLSYKYAKKGTFTPIVPEGKKFKAWEKDGKIVSVDDTYSFMVWTDCELKALFADADEEIIYNGPTRKIFVDEFSGNKIMAEFIGFGNDTVVEKGIILTNGSGATEIAMTTTSTQFTVENNIGATSAAGYAIVENSDGTFTKYIDGTIALTGSAE